MPKRKQSITSWAACKTILKNWPASGVQELVHELYKLSQENQRFLHARLLPRGLGNSVDQARKALEKILSVSSVFNGRFTHAAARRVVDQFEKGCDDPKAVSELLIGDLQIACKTFDQVGDFPAMIKHIDASLNRLGSMMDQLSPSALNELAPGIRALKNEWGESFGYGLSDELSGLAYQWLKKASAGAVDGEPQKYKPDF